MPDPSTFTVFAGPAPQAPPPVRPPTHEFMMAIQNGQACSYCPPDRKRPAVVPLYASEQQPDGSTKFVVRFICAACEIRLRDLVLGTPGQPGLAERVRELEEMVEGLRQDVSLGALQRERDAK